MQAQDAVAAVFPDQLVAETAVKRLTAAGVPLQSISVVCKRHSAGEKVTGLQDARLQDMGGRPRSWDSRGALSGLFLNGVHLTIPTTGPVVVLGHLAHAVSAVDGAVVVGGLGGLAGIQVPEDSVQRYEAAIAADAVLMLAHGQAGDLAQAEDMLKALNPSYLELHPCGRPSVLSAEEVGRLAGMLV